MHSAVPSDRRSIINHIILLGTIITLGNLAEILHKSSRVYLFQQALCSVYYNTENPGEIGLDYQNDESRCKVSKVQSRLSMVDGLDSCLAFLPPLLVLATYKELLPRTGLRRLACLNLACSGFGVFYSATVFWLNHEWATSAALGSFLFDLVGGGSIVRATIIVKCIADVAPAEILANSYNYISAFYFLASVGGSSGGSLLLDDHVFLLNGLSIGVYMLACSVALAIPTYCGLEIEEHDRDITIAPILLNEYEDGSLSSSSAGLLEHNRSDKTLSVVRILTGSWRTSYTSVMNLFDVPPQLLSVLLIYLANGLASRGEVLLPQYTSLLLSWPLAKVNSVMAMKAMTSAIILFLLPTLRRKYLEPRMNTHQTDLFITQASLILNTIGMVGMGLPLGLAGVFVPALAIYTSGIGLADSLAAYGTATLPQGEKTADFYTRTGLIATITGLIGGPLWSTVFSFIVQQTDDNGGGGWLHLGFPFWLCAGLFGLGILGVTRLTRA